MTRVFIVDGSDAQCRFLRGVLERGGIEVTGSVSDGERLPALIQRHAPDVVLVAHQLPVIDGLEVTRRIMESSAVPIVLVAASSKPGEVATGFDAMDAGALAVVSRPSGEDGEADRAAAREMLKTIRVMSEVKVVRRWPKRLATTGAREPVPDGGRIVAVGASTGGPLALAALFGGLPKDFGAPVVVVQHMAVGFMRGFVDWLAPSSALPIHVAADGEYLLPGHIYVAPDGVQMRVTRRQRIALDDAPTENGLRPSVSCLFRSVVDVYGADGIGVLLTGMGRDGARELKLMKDAGGTTFAQDRASSIVYGMPGEAVKLGAAMRVLAPPAIAAELAMLVVAEHGKERK